VVPGCSEALPRSKSTVVFNQHSSGKKSTHTNSETDRIDRRIYFTSSDSDSAFGSKTQKTTNGIRIALSSIRAAGEHGTVPFLPFWLRDWLQGNFTPFRSLFLGKKRGIRGVPPVRGNFASYPAIFFFTLTQAGRLQDIRDPLLGAFFRKDEPFGTPVLPNDTGLMQGNTDPSLTDSRADKTGLENLADEIAREQEALALQRATDAKERREKERLAELERIQREQREEEEKLQKAAAEQADIIKGREQNASQEQRNANEAKNAASNHGRDRHESREHDQRRATETHEEGREKNRHNEHEQRQHDNRGNGHDHSSRREDDNHHGHEHHQRNNDSRDEVPKKTGTCEGDAVPQPAEKANENEPCDKQEAGTEPVTLEEVQVAGDVQAEQTSATSVDVPVVDDGTADGKPTVDGESEASSNVQVSAAAPTETVPEQTSEDGVSNAEDQNEEVGVKEGEEADEKDTDKGDANAGNKKKKNKKKK
jgi:hypothetical protein